MFFRDDLLKEGKKRSIEENYDEYDEINKEISKLLINMNQKDNTNFIKNNNSNQSSLKTNISVEENSENSLNSSLSIDSFKESIAQKEDQNFFFHENNNNISNKNNNTNNLTLYSNVNNNFIIQNIFLPNNNNINIVQSNINKNTQILNKKKQKSKKNKANLDSPKLMIHLDNVLKLKDKRTTLIIRNIPNKYTIQLFQNEINVHFFGKYDILYLPLDFVNKTNLGFGFINFIDPIHILYFFPEFIGKKWNIFNSEKRCQLAYAKIQGKNSLLKYIYKKNMNNKCNLSTNSFFIENNQIRVNEIEIPMQYYISFIRYYPFSICHKKNNYIFIVDKYFNF
jgi:hypothetical protein